MRQIVSIVIVGTLALAARAAAAQELETETARVGEPGLVAGGIGFEYQTSSEGSESALPIFIEAVPVERLELVVEPVPYADVKPKTGASASGPGDLEVTLIGLVLHEAGWMPALALAGEVKIPVASNDLIGTGEYDFTGYLILSRRFGQLDVHFNAGYALLGAPPGVQVSNIFSFALAARYFVGAKLDLHAEVFADTESSGENEGAGTGTGMGASGELAGGELFATVGAGYKLEPWLLLSLGFTYDNNNAFMVHPGAQFKFDLF